MQIECATTSAAAQVLFLLIDAHLQPGKEFHIHGPDLPDPPIHFILHVALSLDLVRRLEGVTDTVVTGEPYFKPSIAPQTAP